MKRDDASLIALLCIFVILAAIWLGATLEYAFVHAYCSVSGKYEHDSFIYTHPLAIECKAKESP